MLIFIFCRYYGHLPINWFIGKDEVDGYIVVIVSGLITLSRNSRKTKPKTPIESIIYYLRLP